MTEKILVIANWKMKLGLQESKDLAAVYKKLVKSEAEVIVCPTFVSLDAVGKVLAGSGIKLGAQDCFWEKSGAFTGEVSVSEIKETGAAFVIIGHSERRKYLNETDEIVHEKTKLAISAALTPIICVGETFDQRQQGAKDYVLINQTTKAVEGLEIEAGQQVIIAYEPVWVIGSGQAIEPQEAEAAHQVIRQSLFDLFSAETVKNNFRIVYGGSVDGQNVHTFTCLNNTSGVLVGGASLTINDFVAIIKNV
ncbi:MAG: triose-phosphate isomerase [Patescibacteria group bacterium]|nr:triose-phosphate isomerase [Patescibacteria group bacterium]